MADLSRIADINITLATAAVTSIGFNDMIVCGVHAHTVALVEQVTDADDLLDMGFASTDPIYIAVNDALSNGINYVYVGKVAPDYALIYPSDVENNSLYKFQLKYKTAGGSVVTANPEFTSDANATASEIAIGIKAAIDALAITGITATIVSDQVQIEYTTDYFSVMAVSDNITAVAGEYTGTVANGLAAIDNVQSVYGVIYASRDQDDILAAAAWIEGKTKLLGTAVAEYGVLDSVSTTDTAYLLKNSNHYRTYAMYHEAAATDYVDAAWMAYMFSNGYPGEANWAHKALSGVSTDALSETSITNATTKNCNTFINYRGGEGRTYHGQVAAGEWIDIIWARDWLEEQIRINIANLQFRVKKIPYTDIGIAMIEQEIRRALELAQRRNVIAPDEVDDAGNTVPGFTISVPLNYNISPNDKGNRILNDVSFVGRLAGAINQAVVRGTLSYTI